MIQIKNLFFQYDGQFLFNDLDLCVEAGASISIVGPSGTGKTTLFHILTGLIKDFEGSVLLSGGPITPDQITYMMQKDLLLPWKTIRENVQVLNEVSNEEALSYLHAVGLGNVINHYPRQLSTGMKQRAALVRALMRKTPFLFLDEAFSSVDPYQKKELQELVLKEQKKRGITLLVITHDLEEAYRMGEVVYFLSGGKLYPAPAQEAFSFFSKGAL